MYALYALGWVAAAAALLCLIALLVWVFTLLFNKVLEEVEAGPFTMQPVEGEAWGHYCDRVRYKYKRR